MHRARHLLMRWTDYRDQRIAEGEILSDMRPYDYQDISLELALPMSNLSPRTQMQAVSPALREVLLKVKNKKLEPSKALLQTFSLQNWLMLFDEVQPLSIFMLPLQ